MTRIDLKGITNPLEAWKKTFPYPVYSVRTQAVADTGEVMPLTQRALISNGIELHSVKPSYELLQIEDLVKCFQPLYDLGILDFDYGEVIHNRRIMIHCSIKNSQKPVVVGDLVATEIVLRTSFDSSWPNSANGFQKRQACLNGMAKSYADDGLSASCKHTKNARILLSDAVQLIKTNLMAQDLAIAKYQELAAKKQTEKQQHAYIAEVFEVTDPEEISPQLQAKVSRVIDLLDEQRGLAELPIIRGTAWQAYNAVSEYLTHEAGRSEDARSASLHYGPNHSLNQKALALALQ